MSKHFFYIVFFNITCLGLFSVSKADPVIIGCPGNITQTITNSCTKAISWTEPTAVGALSSTRSHAPGSDFPVGTTTVVYTFTDALGTSTCSFNVTVRYQFFDLPSDQTITINSPSSCNRTALWPAPTECSNVIIAYSTDPVTDLNNGDPFPIGQTTVTYVALRGATIDDIETFTVTVVDNSPPAFDVVPGDITAAANGNCEAVVSWVIPTVIDNCTGSITPTSPINPGATFPLGSTMVTYSAQDEAGNPATYSFNVIVEDQTGPEFTNLPANITVNSNPTNCRATVTWDAVVATDNCSSAGDINITRSHVPGDIFDLGDTEVTYTATDVEGNQTIDSFIITVVDASAPTLLSCPSDINLTATNSCTAVATWASPNFNDRCDATPTITRSHTSGSAFPIGTTAVTITATDDAGNQTTCSFNVTVTDVSAPTFDSCPANITVATGADGCQATASWTVPTASDNCSLEITPTAAFSPGDTFPLGTTTVTYTAVDVAGNEATCSFDVIVLDETAPVFSDCPADIEVIAGAACATSVSWTPPTAGDNCDNNVTITESHASGDTFPLGTTTVTYTATDAAGNATTCTFNVTVIDQTGPEVTNCPADIEITTAGCESIATWDDIVAIENCSTVTQSSNFSSGDTFPLGNTVVTYTFTDDLGNESQCSFNVSVVNPDALQLIECPQDITVETDDSGRAVVTWTEPIVESICSDFTTTQSHRSGDTFGVGTTLVTYEFADDFGTVISCSFNVIVIIREIAFEIPKLMTPNNDGNNDTWILSGLENFPDNEVLVVDRWGSEIYKGSGYDNQRVVWDGTNQDGKIVPTGTYFYYISVKANDTTQKKQGFIELVQ